MLLVLSTSSIVALNCMASKWKRKREAAVAPEMEVHVGELSLLGINLLDQFASGVSAL